MQFISNYLKEWGEKNKSIIELVVGALMLAATVIVATGFALYYIMETSIIESAPYEENEERYHLWAETIRSVRKNPGTYISEE
jgi:hypothetical protein